MAITKTYPYAYKLPAWALLKTAELSSTAGQYITSYFERGIYCSYVAIGKTGSVVAASQHERFDSLMRHVTTLSASQPIASVRVLAQLYERGVSLQSYSVRVPFVIGTDRRIVSVPYGTVVRAAALKAIAGAYR